MCFSSKPKIPKVQPQAIVPPPAPLLEDPKGVKFGGGDEDYEREEKTDRGRIDLDKKDKEEEEEDHNKPTVAETRRKMSISKAFNKKSTNGGL